MHASDKNDVRLSEQALKLSSPPEEAVPKQHAI
jgi:hypothetical protein